MNKETILNNKITTEQKKRFYQFCIDEFTSKTFYGGFCELYNNFFHNLNGIIDYRLLPELIKRLLPELIKFKPKKHFYDFLNEKTYSEHQFWFPVGYNQTRRINVCKKILKELK